MAANDQINDKFRSGCWREKVCQIEGDAASSGDLFSREWEVFVIKRDPATGKPVGRLACCALAPV